MPHRCKLLVIVLALVGASQWASSADEPSERTGGDKESQAELVESWFYEKEKGFPAGKNHAVGSGHVWTGEQETTEPFDKLWAFYSKRCGHEKPYDEKLLYRTDGPTKDGRYAVHDSNFPVRRTRTVFTYDCPDHSVSVLVFRGDDEETPNRVYLTWIFRRS